jgi:hypothetical protein
MTLIAATRASVTPWDHYEVRDANGHLLTVGKPIGSRVRHPRFRGLVTGELIGRAWSYALACPIR